MALEIRGIRFNIRPVEIGISQEVFTLLLCLSMGRKLKTLSNLNLCFYSMTTSLHFAIPRNPIIISQLSESVKFTYFFLVLVQFLLAINVQHLPCLPPCKNICHCVVGFCAILFHKLKYAQILTDNKHAS